MAETQAQSGAKAAAVDQATMDAVLQETQKKLMERPELLQMRMENESMMAECRVRPRNHETIKAELVEQLRAYPSFARDAIYNKPVGRDTPTGPMKYARNLSIRAAEAIAEAYGYCRIRADVSFVDENTVRIEASFIDYQKCRCWQDAGLLSKFYKTKFGTVKRYADDRFYNLVVKSEVSKRIREVITRSVPPGLRAELFEMAERQIDELLDDKTLQKIIGQFSSKGVTIDQIEAHLGRTQRAGWTKEDRRNLLGIWNAIKDGETTIQEAFVEAAPAATSSGDGPANQGATVEDLVRPVDTDEASTDTGHDIEQEAIIRQEYLDMIGEAESVEQVERCRRRAEEGREKNEISAETVQDVIVHCAERVQALKKWEKAKKARADK